MRFYPTKIHQTFLCFILASFVLNLGCSKDSDILVDSVLNDETISSVEERDASSTDDDSTEEQASEEEETTDETDNQEDNLESRTTSFSPSNDAHFQSGKGYNQNIIRLEEDSRTSYLMFDLNPIAQIEGSITSAHLQFTITGDDGSGTILVHKGNSSDWTEDSLSETTIPQIELQLGEIIKEYKIGATEIIALNSEVMSPAVSTLILEHKNGNDLAFASKEHASKIGPKLVVTYDVIEGAQEIEIIEEPEEEDETSENEKPMAVADATPSSGKLPLEVSFVGSNSSDDQEISSYSWDFKDGSTSSAADPSHTFTEIGTFAVLLTVTDADGLTDTDTVEITVTEEDNQAPTAKVSATPVTGEAPLKVTFTGSESSDDNAITKYDWNFKDGSRTNIADFTYTYTEAGVYEAELTVTDENGLTDAASITITVTEPENEAPKANVTANPTSGNAPLNVQFTGNTSTDDDGITSYFWDFKDGSTAANQNPSHSFVNPGVYAVELTVKDAQGLSDTKSVSITVNEASGGSDDGDDGGSDGGSSGGNAPPGYYVATNGTSYNSGQSASSPWSLEHAFYVAEPGDIIYVKAGNYGNKQIVNYQSGTSSNPIKFIGYTNTPGDLVSSQGSTFSHGQSLNSSKMPLLSGSSGSQGVGVDLNGSYVEVHNFQITNYKVGLFTKGRQVLLKNVIITNTGTQTSNSTQEGRGFQVYGDYTTVENSFVLNSNSEGINLKGANNCKVRYTSVYSDNKTNPTGYYMLISSGASNNTIENCKIYRDKNADLHRGHGYVLKDQATNNIVRYSTAYNTGIEVNFSGVAYNNFQNVNIYGSFSSDNGEFSSSIRVLNGAHHNTFTNINIENSRYAVGFIDLNDGFVGSGGDRDKNEGGHDNKFIGIKSKNTKNIVGVTSDVVGAAAFSNNNEFRNCTFDDVSDVPFYSYQDVNNTKFISCSFKNIPSSTMLKLFNGGTFPISFQSCSFSNIGFPQP